MFRRSAAQRGNGEFELIVTNQGNPENQSHLVFRRYKRGSHTSLWQLPHKDLRRLRKLWKNRLALSNKSL